MFKTLIFAVLLLVSILIFVILFTRWRTSTSVYSVKGLTWLRITPGSPTIIFRLKTRGKKRQKNVL